MKTHRTKYINFGMGSPVREIRSSRRTLTRCGPHEDCDGSGMSSQSLLAPLTSIAPCPSRRVENWPLSEYMGKSSMSMGLCTHILQGMRFPYESQSVGVIQDVRAHGQRRSASCCSTWPLARTTSMHQRSAILLGVDFRVVGSNDPSGLAG